MKKTWDIEIMANLAMAALLLGEDFGAQRFPYVAVFLLNAFWMWGANPVKKRRTVQ